MRIKQELFNVLGCLSVLLSSTAFAEEAEINCETGQCAPVTIQNPVPVFRDVACGATSRDVTYTLVNNEAMQIDLFNIKVISQSGNIPDTPSVTVKPKAGGCISNVTNNIGSGIINGGSTCALTLTVDPSACTGIINGPIARQLYIGVSADQAPITLNLDANITPIGSGAEFALIGGTVGNNLTSSPAQITGDVGATTAITGTIDISNGAQHINDAIFTAAQADLSKGVSTLLAKVGTGATNCQQRYTMYPDSVYYPGYYCLSNGGGDGNFYVGGDNSANDRASITLIGDGTGQANFYFFVDSASTSNKCGGTTPCNLYIVPKTTFAYENDAGPENVFWIIGNTSVSGNVLLNTDAQFEGSILQSAGTGTIAGPAAPGTSPSRMLGTLWSNTAINLYGNAVTATSLIPEFLSDEELNDEQL